MLVFIKLCWNRTMKGLRTEGQIIPDKPVEELWNNTEQQERWTSACNFTQPLEKKGIQLKQRETKYPRILFIDKNSMILQRRKSNY